jgi:hypothetical protein
MVHRIVVKHNILLFWPTVARGKQHKNNENNGCVSHAQKINTCDRERQNAPVNRTIARRLQTPILDFNQRLGLQKSIGTAVKIKQKGEINGT